MARAKMRKNIFVTAWVYLWLVSGQIEGCGESKSSVVVVEYLCSTDHRPGVLVEFSSDTADISELVGWYRVRWSAFPT
jgi:hypothetical protein